MFGNLIGQSPNFEALLRSARMVAATDVTVLIVGETGTGKEMLAQCLQKLSPRSSQPFITINCPALPEALVESELFGHRKGSFTGATGHQTGRFQAAQGGTVFLDEVDSLPLAIQAKLLRFLETGEIQPVGDSASLIVDVRIIAATNANLNERIERGEFRRDLYYRLNVVPLEIPPLRDRAADIRILIEHFIDKFTTDHDLPRPILSKGALLRLARYPWPGNVRELRNVCERLCVLMPDQAVEEHGLPPEIFDPPASRRKHGVELPEEGLSLDELEKDLIVQALERAKGNKAQAARLLGISRDTLLYRIQKHEIELP